MRWPTAVFASVCVAAFAGLCVLAPNIAAWVAIATVWLFMLGLL